MVLASIFLAPEDLVLALMAVMLYIIVLLRIQDRKEHRLKRTNHLNDNGDKKETMADEMQKDANADEEHTASPPLTPAPDRRHLFWMHTQVYDLEETRRDLPTQTLL